MRSKALIAAGAFALSGCASGTESSPSAARVERCVDRLLTNAPDDARSSDVRRYARRTYCEPFERRGEIYDDGALSIGAYTWFERSAKCASASEGEPPTTVPCEELDRPGPRRVECALLRHVRRSEVDAFLRRLERERPVACDDGTSPAGLGVP